MTEAFLIAVTLVTSIIRGEDKFPACVFCLGAHLLYFSSLFITNVVQVFLTALVIDVILVALLVSINGSLRSKLVFMLIPMSLVSIFINFYGWTVYYTHKDYLLLSIITTAYWLVILGVFWSRAGGNGDTFRHSRLLRRDNNSSKNMGLVSK